MRRTGVIATVLALGVVVSLLGASDVRGGGGAVTPAGKTTGPGLVATIVTDVTGPSGTTGKGLTTIRVQRASASAAVVFNSSYVNGFINECKADPLDVAGTTANRFVGFLMDAFVDFPGVLDSLLQNFGNPKKAAITSVDYAVCGPVTYKDNSVPPQVITVRQILSFTAVIQFQP